MTSSSSPPPRPEALEVRPRNIPQALKEARGWVLWRWYLKGGKWTKPAYNTDGVRIDITNPDNWTDFSTALQTYQRGEFDGIGISMNALENLAGVDLDHCIENGKIAPWAEDIVRQLGSYAEISPSGTGLRVFGFGHIESENGRKKGDIEMYHEGRYLTATGHHLDISPFDVVDFDEALNALHDQVWGGDQEVKGQPDLRPDEIGDDLAERFAALCDDDPIFREKYYSPASVGDRSDIEFNLCAKLYEEGFSASEIRSLMDSSPQEKWKSRDDKYREGTIQNAIRSAAAPKTTRRVRPKEDPAELLETLEEKLSEDPDAIRDPAVKKMLATYRRLDAVGYESLLKRVGIRGDLKKALGSDLKHINDDGDDEKGGRGPSMATRIVDLALASGALFWKSPEGEPFATIPNGGDHTENHPLRSKAAKTWLSGLLYEAEGRAPKGSAVMDALAVLEGRAIFEGETFPVFVRLAESGGKFYLDLGGDDWRAVEIDSGGWRVIPSEAVPVKFRRPKGFMELPEPKRGGDLEDLRRVLNVPGGAPWVLVRAWLVQAFNPSGPYPVLIVDGEQGSGKSWLGRILRAAVDPNKSPLRRPPRNEHEMMISGSNSWLQTYDNLSGLPPWLGDAICVMSTGGGMSTRELYTDSEEALFDIQRPVVLNGIDALTTRGDLLDRAILLHLPRIEDKDRMTEKEILAEVERIRPGVLGAILDVISSGLRELPNVRLESKPRMADFAEWVVACEGALGWEKGEFLEAFEENQNESKVALIENDMFAVSLMEFVDGLPDPEKGVTDTAGGLLSILEARSNIAAGHMPAGWPKSAKAAGNKIRRIIPALRAVGIEVAFKTGHRKVRLIEIKRHTASEKDSTASGGRVPPPPGSLAGDGNGVRGVHGGGRPLTLTLDEKKREGERKEREEGEGKDRKSPPPSPPQPQDSGFVEYVEYMGGDTEAVAGEIPEPSDDYQSIAANLAEDRRRQAEEDERTATPPPKCDEGRAPTSEESEVLADVARRILQNWPGIAEARLWELAREKLGSPLPLAVVKAWLKESGYTEAGRLNGSPLWNPPAAGEVVG